MAWLMHVDYRRLRRPGVIYTLLGGVAGAAGRRALLAAAQRHPPLVLRRRRVDPALGAGEAGADPLPRLPDRAQGGAGHELSFLLPAAFFTVLTAALILLEPDMGTAVLLCATFFLMIFLAGLSWRYIVAALAAGAAGPDRRW